MLSQETLIQSAIEVGFDDCGMVAASRLDEDARFMDSWLSQNLHGNMSYLERNRELRYDPRQLVPGARTVVVTVLSYEHSGHDYHRTVKSKLYELEARLIEKGFCQPSEHQNKFCDSAPFLERRWAERSGLGFIGKNHQFIHRTLGSYVHLGELVLPVDVVPASTPTSVWSCPPECTRCIDACPGQALGQTVWDARKCVAYTTHKCTICQQVCPINMTLNKSL
ncbi:MAG: DUF1730 domain-containing protein [Paludibacteraceae bacterium]|nr:DUF1730 domain-containing protein [Paludibacteraceae bacterium]